MPLINDAGDTTNIIKIATQEDAIVESPDIGATFGAGFRVENSLVSAAANGFSMSNDFTTQEGYDPFAQNEAGETDITGYESFAESFSLSRSEAETQFIKGGVDRELQDRKDLEAAGALGIAAQFAGGALDPLYMLPFLRAGKTLTTAGAVAEFAAVGSVAELGAEMAKHESQSARTTEESLINIGGAALISGIIGGAARSFARSDIEGLSKRVNEITDSEISASALLDPVTDGYGSIGAAKVREVTLEEETLVSAGGLEKLPLSPLARTLNSPSKSSRVTMETMSENPLLFKKNLDGIATGPEGGSVETRSKQWDAGLATGLEDLDAQYLSYRESKSKAGMVVNTMLQGRKGKLNFDDFRVEVGKAMRNGDKHIIPEVEASARSWRKNLFDPLKDAAIEQDLLPVDVDVKTATSYLTRVYNTQKIINERGKWDKIIFDWLSIQRFSASKKLGKLKTKLDATDAKQAKDIKKLQGQIEKQGELGNASDLEIQDIVNQITDSITGNNSGRNSFAPIPLTRGPLNERTLNIQDVYIEGFLESDIDMVARQYKRTMAPEVELTRAFGRADMQDQLDEIKGDYAKLREAAKREGKSEKILADLDKKEKQDIIDTEAVRDMLRGTYRTPENPDAFFIRAGRVLRDANFVRMLGGMTLSAIPDMARPIAVNGFKPVGRALASLITSPKKFKLSRLEAKKAGVGLDMVLNSRASSLAELTDIYARNTKFERGLRGLSDGFSKLTLMAPWNASMKQFTGVLTADRILTESVNLAGGKAKKSAITRLASSGIDKQMAGRIAKEFKKHGDGGDLNLSNGHLWSDREALQSFQSAVLKDVDRAILTPGVAEKPLWTSSETGKMIFQFKTFASVAHSKVMVADLQYRDASALNGLLMAVALGGLAYGAKQVTAGRDLSSDPEKLLVESLDRSGVFGYFWDINNIVEKATRGSVGVNAAIGAEPMSRYASRNITGSLLGPSLGTVQDLFQVTGSASQGEMTKSDIRAMRKMLPYQNLFYIRKLLDELEETTAEAVGAN